MTQTEFNKELDQYLKYTLHTDLQNADAQQMYQGYPLWSIGSWRRSVLLLTKRNLTSKRKKAVRRKSLTSAWSS